MLWTTARQRWTETVTMTALWVTFVQAYASRLLHWWLFGALAMLLVYAVARFLNEAVRRAGAPGVG